MTSILALETSGPLCSVAVDVDGSCFALTHHVERRHNELLLGMIDEVLRKSGTARQQIDALAFGCGPGSFTGVRIAAAAVQGIALALEVPVLAIGSAEVLAEAWLRSGGRTDGSPAILLTAIRSRAQAYYLASFRVQAQALTQLTPDTLFESAADFGTQDTDPQQLICVGAQPEWWSGPSFDGSIQATAEDVVAIARARFADGSGVDAAAALPVYVVGDSPWRRTGGA